MVGETFRAQEHPRDAQGRFRPKPYGDTGDPSRLISGEPSQIYDFESEDWAAEQFESAEELPDDEYEALDSYKRDLWEDLNPALRGTDESWEGGDRAIEKIDRVLSRNRLKEDVVVTRGLLSLDALPDGWDETGAEIVDDAYMSTSLAEAPPGIYEEGAAVLHLKVPKGTPAYFMEPFNEFAESEEELLLGRGRTFVVDEVVDEGGQTHVYAEILGYG